MKPGYIYVIYNPMYDHYGKNIYKIGETSNPQKRLDNYTTPYIDPCKLAYQSIKLPDSKLAETIVFERLSTYRIRQEREFFQCEISHIISIIEFMAQQLLKLNTDEIIYLKGTNNPSLLISTQVVIPSDQKDSKNYVCENCYRQFSHKTNMYRHIRSTCTVKKIKHAVDESVKNQPKTDLVLQRLDKLESDMAIIKNNSK